MAEDLRLTLTTSAHFKRLKGTKARDHIQAGPWDVVVEDAAGAIIVQVRETLQPFEEVFRGLDAAGVDWNTPIRCTVAGLTPRPRLRVHALCNRRVRPDRGGLAKTAGDLLWDLSGAPSAKLLTRVDWLDVKAEVRRSAHLRPPAHPRPYPLRPVREPAQRRLGGHCGETATGFLGRTTC